MKDKVGMMEITYNNGHVEVRVNGKEMGKWFCDDEIPIELFEIIKDNMCLHNDNDEDEGDSQ